MINTNINDYIIFEKGWKGARKKRSLHHKILDLRMASTEEYGKLLSNSYTIETLDFKHFSKYNFYVASIR